MTFWAIRKRYAVDFIRRWYVFLLWATIGALVLRVNAGLSWSFILVFLFGLFAARFVAEDVVQRWSKRYLSPGRGGLSIANPRVWTFELRLTKTFIEEVSAQLSNRFSEHKEVTDRLLSPSLRKSLNATSEVLQKLVIEEYPSRVRVHLWLVSDSESHEPRYDWFDLDGSAGRYRKFDEGGGRHLWAYAADAMVGGSLSLSGSWEWDSSKKRKLFQLTLWVDHEVVRNLTREWPTKQIPPTDLIFKIPLEPGRLCDEQGQTGDVPRKDLAYKAGEVDSFPYHEHTWEDKSGEGSDWHWSWYLHMKTFNSGFSI